MDEGIKQEKIKLLNISMMNATVAIITIVVFIIVSYNKQLILMGKKPLFDSEKFSDIIIINRFIILITLIVSVYLNYRSYKIAEEMESDLVTYVAKIEYLVTYLPLIEIIILVILSVRYLNIIETEDLGPIII